MDAPPPAPVQIPLPPPRPWRIVAVAIVTAAVVVSGVTAYWAVTGGGPFADITPSTWAFEMAQVTDLHDAQLSGAGVRMCIVDTGLDLTHPDLQHLTLIAWRDFVNGRADPYDDQGHGTAMAGIIFARGRLHGIAPDAELIAVKAISASGSGADARIANAISFCTDPNRDGSPMDGAHVISLSLGGGSHPFLGSATEAAVNLAMDRGAIVVAAAGNDGQEDDGDVESPASVSRVVAVGAVDRRGIIAPFSSRGENNGGFPSQQREDPNRKPEVVAPGVGISTLLVGAAYGFVSGTSPAAAFVAGVIALLLEAHPNYRLNPFQLQPLKTALMQGALPVDGQTLPHDEHYGYGIAQALAASQRM